MDARLLDMLEDPGNRDILAVADRVDVDLDRVAQVAVDQTGLDPDTATAVAM